MHQPLAVPNLLKFIVSKIIKSYILPVSLISENILSTILYTVLYQTNLLKSHQSINNSY